MEYPTTGQPVDATIAARAEGIRARADRLETFFERRAAICATVGRDDRARPLLMAAAHLDMLGRGLLAMEVETPLNGDRAIVHDALAALDAALAGVDDITDEPASLLVLCAALAGAAEATDRMADAPSLPAVTALAPRHLRGLVRAIAAASARSPTSAIRPPG